MGFFQLLIFKNLFSVSDFGSLFDLEHDLPDELISSHEPGLVNGGDLNQLHTSLGGGAQGLGPAGGNGGPGGLGVGLGSGGGQDAVAKHKQLSELLRSGAPGSNQQGHQGAMGSPGGPTGMGQHLANMKASPGQAPQQMMSQGQQHLSPQQQANMMQQNAAAGMMSNMNRAMMGAQQKANNVQQQQQGMMGNQVINGSPRMGFGNQGMPGSSNLLAETLQQQGAGGQTAMRGQQPGAMNKVGSPVFQLICNFYSLKCFALKRGGRKANREIERSEIPVCDQCYRIHSKNVLITQTLTTGRLKSQ